MPPQDPLVSLVSLATAAVGLGLAVAGILGFAQRVVYSTRYPVVPVLLGLGLVLLGHAGYLHAALNPALYPPRLLRVAAGIGLTLFLMLMFWITAVYAQMVGSDAARRLEAEHFRVLAYSGEDLAFNERITTEVVGRTVDGYRYKYSA